MPTLILDKAAPGDAPGAEFGFREGTRSVHTSRTIMLAELRELMGARNGEATRDDYRAAILNENALGKGTMSARRNTFERLAEMYALDPHVTVFRVFRHYWGLDAEGRPLLALLCATARDPLLGATGRAVLALKAGEAVPPDLFPSVVEESTSGRYSSVVLRAVASRLASSWTQSGHLTGTRARRRGRAVATPGSAALALALGYLQGARGRLLFSTLWARLLDRSEDEVGELAAEASRRGWLNYRRAGGVVEVRFPGLFTEAEEGRMRGEG